jgi:hypothetical protein
LLKPEAVEEEAAVRAVAEPLEAALRWAAVARQAVEWGPTAR